jgi:hypothetical protein
MKNRNRKKLIAITDKISRVNYLLIDIKKYTNVNKLKWPLSRFNLQNLN